MMIPKVYVPGNKGAWLMSNKMLVVHKTLLVLSAVTSNICKRITTFSVSHLIPLHRGMSVDEIRAR
jgi:hypothetical protein